VKLSQQTGDHAAACDRWSEAHARIEASIRNATTLAKRKEEAKRKPEMARTLTSNENVTIAGQARCDVLAITTSAGVISTTCRRPRADGSAPSTPGKSISRAIRK